MALYNRSIVLDFGVIRKEEDLYFDGNYSGAEY